MSFYFELKLAASRDSQKVPNHLLLLSLDLDSFTAQKEDLQQSYFTIYT